MIVVAIIGILASVAVPQYKNYVIRAEIADLINQANSPKIALAEYYMVMSNMPTNADSGGFGYISDVSTNYVWSVEYARSTSPVSVLTVTGKNRNPSGRSPIKGYAIDITATGSNDGITYDCASAATNGLSSDQLPSTCR